MIEANTHYSITHKDMEELIPQMNGEYTHYKKVVYRLTGYTVDEGKNATYPTFKRHSSESSIHENFEDAKQRLLSIINNEDSDIFIWHSFIIDEVPFGVNCMTSGFQKRWVYDSEGAFVAESACSRLDDADGNWDLFKGRDEKDCIFKPGDVVEVISTNWSSLAIIYATPITKEEYNKNPGRYNFAGDEYLILNFTHDNYPIEAEVIDCFPAKTLPMNEETKARLEEIYRDYKHTRRNK